MSWNHGGHSYKWHLQLRHFFLLVVNTTWSYGLAII